MRRFSVAASALWFGVLAPACATGALEEIDQLAAEHMATCVTPYLQASLPDEDALVARLAASNAAAGLLARLRDGAPAQWRDDFGDASVPLRERVAAAVNLVGMMISHGAGRERAVARAYSAYCLSGATQGRCPAPAQLASFVASTSFWPAEAGAPNPSAPPIVPSP